MRTEDFDYYLPPELIAQEPIEHRDSSRLLVLNRENKTIEHHHFYNLPDFLKDGDVMVFNDSRVIPARIPGKKANSGGAVEVLLLRRLDSNLWETLVKPGRRVKTGTLLNVGGNCESASRTAEVVGEGDRGIRIIRFFDEGKLFELGQVALPPYIHKPLQNPERYQTVYSENSGSVAAPTAGLHFTPDMLKKIEAQGVKCLYVTLHVGLDTFRPVHEDDPREHRIHQEYGVLSEEVAAELSLSRKEGRRIIPVGTTSMRLIEAVARFSGGFPLKAFEDWVDLFILPGYDFKVADAMITNFHLPKSTLLMLVSAFAGKDFIDSAYRTAIDEKYRFYSFGDATLIL